LAAKPFRPTLIWKSLKTTTFSVAKQRLPDTLRDHRSKIESLTAFAEGKMTVGNTVDVYLQKVRASISLKPRSKDYRELMIDFIRRSWPSLLETDVRKVLSRDCELWLGRYQPRYFPSVINNRIAMLRAIFDEAISIGARFNNPAAALSRVKVEFRPKMVRQLEAKGAFMEAVFEAQERTIGEMEALTRKLEAEQKLTPQQAHDRAWEMIREKYILLPPEENS
jgi:hypothetical protein